MSECWLPSQQTMQASKLRRSPRRAATASLAGDDAPPKRKKQKGEEAFRVDQQRDTAAIRDHCNELLRQRNAEGLENVRDQLKTALCTEEVGRVSREDLFDVLCDVFLMVDRLLTEQQRGHQGPAPLGSHISSLGFGSSAGKIENQAKVDAALSSFDESKSDRKGAMLAHCFYRSFLKHIYSDDHKDDNLQPVKQQFLARLQLIWKDTNIGIVRHKNNNGSTPEAPATSLLAADINQLISKIVDIYKPPTTEVSQQVSRRCIKFASEYILAHQNESDKAESSAGSERGKSTSNPKTPRTDGLFVASDPNNNDALRALVSMKAKLGKFDVSAQYQSRSNAVDVFSQQESGGRPWPLLLFRYTLRHRTSDSVKVLSFVPTTEISARAVTLWEGESEDSIYRSILAAVRATMEFIDITIQQEATPLFCSVHGNVVLDSTEGMVYKCFFDPKRRRDNIQLIRDFVDPAAQSVPLGQEGCYVKMKWVGSMLSDDDTCSMLAFLQIVKELERLHTAGYCHGDIRVSNLILHPVQGGQAKLVDFDLSGKTKEDTYPSSLLTLGVDGKRHPDVEEGIRTGRVGSITLEQEHDWFSLAEAMSCFTTTSDTDAEIWTQFIQDVRFGPCHMEEVGLQDKWVKLNDGIRSNATPTGSPTRGPT